MTELRDALRALRATPVVTAVAILSLALGIGANTAMFSIADALLLRPLPVEHADRLVLLTGDATPAATWWTNPIWEAIRDRPELHDGGFAYSTNGFDLAERGEVDEVAGLRASGRMFEVLGVRAWVGRTFTAADDRRDGGPDGPVAVLSHRYWQQGYGGAADAVGRTITLNHVPFTIVGVTPPGFFGPEVGRAFDVAVPLNTVALLNRSAGSLESRSSWWLKVMLRLPSGQTAEEATTRLRAVQHQIADETRPTDLRPQDAADHLLRPFTLAAATVGSSELRGSYARPVLALMAIVGLTLLIASGNIANLMLARAASRRHELSVRTALGASGGRLARNLLIESLVLSAAGAALGVLVAFAGSRLIVAQLSTASDPVFLAVGVDWRMLAFTGAVAAGTTLLFGTVPAIRAARIAPMDAMREQGRSTSSGRRVGLAGTLVTAQVALSLLLLLGAGLFVRTFASLATLDLGFDKDRVLLVHLGTRHAGVESGDARRAMFDRVLEAARGVPGVAHASLSELTPGGGGMSNLRMEFPDRPDIPESERIVHMNVVSPGWFATLGMPLLAGRDFDARDRLGAPRAVIVNRAFAGKYFAGESPLGRRIRESPRAGDDPAPLEIVGVVSDAVYRTPREGAPPTMYWALAQREHPPGGVSIVVRAAAGPPAALTRSTGTAVMSVNPDLLLVFQPLAQKVDESLTRERLLATLSGFFGVLGLVLAALGLYGVTAYAVTRRRVEIGIRLALGTTPADVVRMVLRRVALLAGVGVLIGTALGAWAATFVESLVFGFEPHDPATLAVAIALLLGISALAGGIPAVRAARLDPARVLRDG